MTNRNIDQIRDLLLGEFIHEFDRRMAHVEEQLHDVEQNTTKSITQLRQIFYKKLDEINANHNRQYGFIEDRINQQIKEQKSFTQLQLHSIKHELTKEKESLGEALSMLKTRFEKNMLLLQKDYRSKMVSKQTLAGVLFEQSLRLKGESIEQSLQSEVEQARS